MSIDLNTTRGGNRLPVRHASRAAAFSALAGLVLAATSLPALAGVNELGGVERKRQPNSYTVISGQPAGQASVSSTYVFSSDDNGKSIRIEVKNGVVTHAEVDGQTIPDNRIERDGDLIRLKGDKGETLAEHRVPASNLNPLGGLTTSGSPLGARSFVIGTPGSALSSVPGAFAIANADPVAATPPPVMVGIQMATPDATLRGHLGLKEGTSTMLSAVHEGLPASKAGLSPYDIIVSIDGKDDASPEAIRAALKDKKAGDTVKLGVIQKGARKDITLTVEGYDRKKLDEAKINAIAGSNGWRGFDQNWLATNKELVKTLSGAGLDDQQLQEVLGRIQSGMNIAGNPFMQLYTDPTGRAPRALIEAERTARDRAAMAQLDAEKALADAARAHRPAQLEDMRRQLEELHKMMQRMMEEKSNDIKPQEDKAAPPPHESRS